MFPKTLGTTLKYQTKYQAKHRGVAQRLERSVVCGDVAGSSPVTLVFQRLMLSILWLSRQVVEGIGLQNRHREFKSHLSLGNNAV